MCYKRRNYVELKTSTFTKNKNFVENLVTFRRTKHSKKKTYTFTKINCLLQNRIKEYASSPENLVKDLELSQYEYTSDALLTHKGIYSIYISISCLQKI